MAGDSVAGMVLASCGAVVALAMLVMGFTSARADADAPSPEELVLGSLHFQKGDAWELMEPVPRARPKNEVRSEELEQALAQARQVLADFEERTKGRPLAEALLPYGPPQLRTFLNKTADAVDAQWQDYEMAGIAALLRSVALIAQLEAQKAEAGNEFEGAKMLFLEYARVKAFLAPLAKRRRTPIVAAKAVYAKLVGRMQSLLRNTRGLSGWVFEAMERDKQVGLALQDILDGLSSDDE